MTFLFLIAGLLVFWFATTRFIGDKLPFRYWVVRVTVAVVAGLTLAKITPLYTHWEDVYNNPVLLLFLSGGLGGLMGGSLMAATIVLLSLFEARRHWPLTRRQLLVPVASGLAAFLVLWGGVLLFTPVPPPLDEAARQYLLPQPGRADAAISQAENQLLIVNFTKPGFLPSEAEALDFAAFRSRSPQALVWTVEVTADNADELRKTFGVANLPATLVVDRTGAVVERRQGGADLPWLLWLEFRHGR